MRIEGFVVDEDLRAAFLRIFIKKRRTGYLENILLLAAPLEQNSFL